jgi:hypothetical protein
MSHRGKELTRWKKIIRRPRNDLENSQGTSITCLKATYSSYSGGNSIQPAHLDTVQGDSRIRGSQYVHPARLGGSPEISDCRKVRRWFRDIFQALAAVHLRYDRPIIVESHEEFVNLRTNIITIKFKELLSLCLVCYRHGQTLLHMGSGQCIFKVALCIGGVGGCNPCRQTLLHVDRGCLCRILLKNNEVDGPLWAAEEG